MVDETRVGGVSFRIEAENGDSIDRATDSMERMVDAADKVDDANRSNSRTTREAGREVDRYGNELTEADRAQGRFIDSAGRMREATGRFVPGMRQAGSAAARYSDNAASAAQANSRQLTPSLNRLQTPVTAIAQGIAAASTAIVGLVAVVGDQVRESDNLARSLGISTQALQQFQSVAATVGVEADNSAQILVDLNDRIGDFIRTGGGEGADIFEQLNVSAEELSQLGADEALLRIGNALGEVQTRGEQIFFAESLANDLSRLLPLITDNQEEFERLAEAAVESGRALSTFDNAQLVQASTEISELGRNIQGVLNQIAADFSPLVTVGTEAVNSLVQAFDSSLVESFVSFSTDAIAVLLDAIQILEEDLRQAGIGWTSLAAFATRAIADIADPLSALINNVLDPFITVLSTVAQGWSNIAAAASQLTVGQTSEFFAGVRDSLQGFSESAASFRVSADDIRDANASVNRSLLEQIDALDQLANSPGYSDQFRNRLAALRDELEQKVAADNRSVVSATASARAINTQSAAIDSQRQVLDGYAEDIIEGGVTLEEFTIAQQELNQAVIDGEIAYDDARVVIDRLAEEYDSTRTSSSRLLGEITRQIGALDDAEDAARRVAEAFQRAQEIHAQGLLSDEDLESYGGILSELISDLAEAGEDSGRLFSESFAENIEFSALSGGLSGAFNSIGNELGRQISSSISESISSSLTDSLGGQGAGIAGGLIGGTLANAFVGIASGIFSGPTRTTIAEGFDVNIVANTISEAFDTEVIRRSSIFGSSTRQYRDAVSEVTLQAINNTFDQVAQDLNRAAEVVGVNLAEFTGEISVRNGDVADALSQSADEIVSASVPAIEQYNNIGETFVQTFARLASNAEAVNNSLSLIGVTADTQAVQAATSAQGLAASYQSQADVINQQITDIRQQIADLEPLTGTFSQEFELDQFEASRRARAQIADLESTLSILEESLTETLSNLSASASEGVISFREGFIEAIAEIQDIPIAEAANELVRLSESYGESFFSSTEIVQRSVDAALQELSRFEDIGVTPATSLEALRFEIEQFSASDAFTPEGLARYLSAADALLNYNLAIDEQAEVFEDAAQASELALLSTESAISSLNDAISNIGGGRASTSALASTNLDQVFSDIESEFSGIGNIIGGITTNIDQMRAAFDEARIQGLELVDPVDGIGAQIADAYEQVLGRLPDQAGLDFWVDAVESNALTISQVFDSISASAEAGDIERFNELAQSIAAYNNLVDEVNNAIAIEEANSQAVNDNSSAVRDNSSAYDDSSRILSQQNSLLLEFNRLGEDLAILTGDQALREESLAAIREIEISQIDGSLLSLFDSIEAREQEIATIEENNRRMAEFSRLLDRDVSEAISAAEQAIFTESERIRESYQEQIDAIRATVDAEDDLVNARNASIESLRDVLQLLDSSADQVRFSTTFAQQQAASARIQSFIDDGVTPSASELEPILSRLTDINADQFDTDQAAEFAQAVAANQIAQLRENAEGQLSTEERTLAEIEDSNTESALQREEQINLLEQQRDNEILANENQLNALLGIDNSVLSVAEAINNLSNLLSSQQQAQQQVSLPSGASIVSQTASGGGVSTTFETADGAIGVIDAFPRRDSGRQAGITINPDTGEIISSFDTGLGSFENGGPTGLSRFASGITGFTHENEVVINAAATRSIGVPALSALNAGRSPAEIFGSSDTIAQSIIASGIQRLTDVVSSAYSQLTSDQREVREILDSVFAGDSLVVVQRDQLDEAM